MVAGFLVRGHRLLIALRTFTVLSRYINVSASRGAFGNAANVTETGRPRIDAPVSILALIQFAGIARKAEGRLRQ
jgi:hypothetical protein